jgi:CubicO group peptidase (beta-lactamase class C family)
MKRYQTISRLFQVVTLITVALVFGPGSAITGAASASSTLDFTAIDAYVATQMKEQRIPGLAIGIVQGDQVVHLKGFGQADASGRAVTPQTPFILASVSKPITALAVMQLVEQGKLELDAPVQRYLPSFRVADLDASSHITVRHLLSHTSGLPESADVVLLTSTDTSDGALERQVHELASVQLNRPVGASFEYANVNYATLGLLVQAVSGQSYEAYVQQHVFGPLDMRHSYTSQAEAQPQGLANGSRYWFGVPIPADVPDNRAERPNGRLIASAEDMAHFLIAQLNGGQYAGAALLSPAGIAAMHQPAAQIGGGEAGYGLGWYSGQRNGVTTVEHAGDGVNFHANVVLVPERALGIVLLENAQNGLKPELMSGIARGVTTLLLGEQPARMESGGLKLMVYYAVLVLAVIQLFGIIWSIRQIRRWGAQPEARPRGWRGIVWHIVLPLVLNLAHGLVFLVGLPAMFSATLGYLCLYVPDFGYTLIVSGSLAVVWAIVRTMLVCGLLHDRLTAAVAALEHAAQRIRSLCA